VYIPPFCAGSKATCAPASSTNYGIKLILTFNISRTSITNITQKCAFLGARIELRIEIGLWAACPRNHGSIPSRAQHFLLLQSIQTSYRSHPAAHYSVGTM